MDVVRRNIKSLEGTVPVRPSRERLYLTVSLPLTLASPQPHDHARGGETSLSHYQHH